MRILQQRFEVKLGKSFEGHETLHQHGVDETMTGFKYDKLL